MAVDQKYSIFFRGLASTPFGVGVWDENRKEVEYIPINKETGGETRQEYDRLVKELSQKYNIKRDG